jgi:hypothetical protein
MHLKTRIKDGNSEQDAIRIEDSSVERLASQAE